MEKMTLIDENQYFVESKKAIQIVLEKESSLEKQLGLREKLQLVKEHKKNTTSPEEYDELEKLEKDLEKKIRFKQFKTPAIPEERKETVKRNVVAEELQVNEKLNELKAELKERITYLENDLLPLIENIHTLERIKGIPHKIDTILNAEIGEGVSFPVRYVLNVQTQSNDELQSKIALKTLKKVLGSLKKIEVPVETKGLLDFLKRGRK